MLNHHGWYELNLNDTVKFIILCFKNHQWKIGLKWLEGHLFFDKKWFDFVRSASITEGDVLVLYESDTCLKFQVCVFEKSSIASKG